ncbi:DfsB family protein [Cereibacter changlensis JA139]|uniref:DfsB family protein n=2 Tax=Cereibacter changlensis TaxID=402884 RepID=A0A2T4JUY7_9RHOB|nr:ClbS/DfsB family four-helix bundle protein [Cereibacter changlensis]PTE21731.1 DfsB family protein [Cereibacter changlensis JA139]
MAVPASKADLLAAISTTFGKLMFDLARVPQELARDPSLEGHVSGTVMSPADLVAYLLGWNELVLKWLERDDRGEPVDFPETGFQWNQLGALAQKFYADHRSLDWPELLARLSATNAQLASTVSSRPDDELYGRPWYGKWTKGRMIQFNTSSPYANARGRIRRWLKEQR